MISGSPAAASERRQEVLAGDDVIDDLAGLDHAGPSHDHRHAEAAFKGRAFLAAERGVAAVRPGKDLGAVIAGENHDGVVGDAEVIDLLEDSSRRPHPVPSWRRHRGRSRSCSATWARDASTHGCASSCARGRTACWPSRERSMKSSDRRTSSSSTSSMLNLALGSMFGCGGSGPASAMVCFQPCPSADQRSDRRRRWPCESTMLRGPKLARNCGDFG